MASMLKELREEADWSQAELAEAAGGIDASYVSLLERERRKATVYIAMAITDALSKRLGRPIAMSDVFGTKPRSTSRVSSNAERERGERHSSSQATSTA